MCNTRVLRCADTFILGLALVVSITSTAPVRASDCCAPCTAPSPPPTGTFYPITVVNNIQNYSYGTITVNGASVSVTVPDSQIWLYPLNTGAATWYYQNSSSSDVSYCVWPTYPTNSPGGGDGLLRPLSLAEINGSPNGNGQGTVWISGNSNGAVLQAFAYDCGAGSSNCTPGYPRYDFITNANSAGNNAQGYPPRYTNVPAVMSAKFEISGASSDITAIDQFSLATQMRVYKDENPQQINFRVGFTGVKTTSAIVAELQSAAAGGTANGYIDQVYPAGLGTAVWNAPNQSDDASKGSSLWGNPQYPQYFNAATTRPQVPNQVNWSSANATWFGSTPGLFPSAWAPFDPKQNYNGVQLNFPQWADVVTPSPTQNDIPNTELRNAVISTGLPWKVKDKQTGLDMVLIPPGTFQMGCVTPPSPGGPNGGCIDFSNPTFGYGKETPTQSVAITRPFYLSINEVTQLVWASQNISGPSAIDDYDCATCPIENITWQQIQDFLGKTALRLPSEAEWEFAYRAGTTTAFHGYPGQPNGTNDSSQLGTIAVFGQTAGIPAHVASKEPNGFGLYDMAGNVWEWVADPYEQYPDPASAQPIVDRFGEINAENPVVKAVPPDSPTSDGSMYYGVIRGGAFDRPEWECTASRRDAYYTKGTVMKRIGFRVARSAGTLPVVPKDFVSNTGLVDKGGGNQTLPYGKAAVSQKVSLSFNPSKTVGTLVWGPTDPAILPVATQNDSSKNLTVVGTSTSYATYLELLSRHPQNKDGFLIDYYAGWDTGYCAANGILKRCEDDDYQTCTKGPVDSHVGPPGYSFKLQVTGVPPNQGLKIFDITINRSAINGVDPAHLVKAASRAGVTLYDGTPTGGNGTAGNYYYSINSGPTGGNVTTIYYCCSDGATLPAGSASCQSCGCGPISSTAPTGNGWIKVNGFPWATDVPWETTLQGSKNWDNEGLVAGALANSYITVAANGTTLAVPEQPQTGTNCAPLCGISGPLPYYPLPQSANGGVATRNAIANWTDLLITEASSGTYARKYTYESAWNSVWTQQTCSFGQQQGNCAIDSGIACVGMGQGCYGLDEAIQLHNWPDSQTSGTDNPLQYAGRTGYWTQAFIANMMFTASVVLSYGVLPIDPNEPWPSAVGGHPSGQGFAFLAQFYDFTKNYYGGVPKPQDPKPVFKNGTLPNAGGSWYPVVLMNEMFAGGGNLPAYVTSQGDRWAKSSPLFTVGTQLGQNVWVLSPGPPSTISSDLDGSGCVDSTDLTLLLTGWGAPCGKVGCEEDLNDDGLVDGADVAVLFGEWGLGCGGSP